MAVRSCESEPDLDRVERRRRWIAPVRERVVGIDPGLNVTGYAVVDPSRRGPYVVEAGVIRPAAHCDGDGPAARRTSTRAIARGPRRLPPRRRGAGAGPQPRQVSRARPS